MKTDYAMDEMQKRTKSWVGVSDVTDNKLLWRQLVAELAGTFLLVAVGVASCVAMNGESAYRVVSIALAFGLIVASVVQVRGLIFSHFDDPLICHRISDRSVTRYVCYSDCRWSLPARRRRQKGVAETRVNATGASASTTVAVAQPTAFARPLFPFRGGSKGSEMTRLV
ncbi:Aquaporin AQPcic [Eumeta japonica]|uniref:Aquaporin AQPcic n=1 Tax=Eumeta variegata TaxID=151549 RepID=A0A4C1UPG6_EUMVA|nr:Aquaporin AQPcic [Eumeta japonica]